MAKIILIDDDKKILNDAGNYLINKGHEVLCYESPVNLMKEIELHNPEIIVFDIDGAEFDGKEICAQIKSSAHKHIPILLLSDNVDDDGSIEVSKAEMLFKKPHDSTQLHHMIKAYL